jgi:micrococcal nuclease
MNQKTGCVRGCLPAFGGFVRAVFVFFFQLLKSAVAVVRWWIERIRQARTPLEAGMWLAGGLLVLLSVGFWADRTEIGLAERSARWTATAAAEETATAVAQAPLPTATVDARATTLASDPSPTPAQATADATAAARATTLASDPSPTPAQATAAAALPAAPSATSVPPTAAAALPPAPSETPPPPTAAVALPPAPSETTAPPTTAPAVPAAPAADYPQPSDRRLAGRIVKVVDGDTVDIVIDGVESRVRLIGVDTPESVDPREPVQCYGREASAYTKRLLDGQSVLLEVDPTQGEFDRYNRRLGYIWTLDGRLANYDLIRDGYAFEYTYNQPYRYQDAFKAAQRTARETAAGLWAPDACGGDVYRGVDGAESRPTTAAGGSGSSGGGTTGGSPRCPASPDPASANEPRLTLDVDKAGETVTVSNSSGESIDLSGWYVCSLTGSQLHAVLAGTIAPGSQLQVDSTAGKAIWNNSSADPGALLRPDGTLAAYWAD